MLKVLECLANITWHGEINCFVTIVPGERDSTEKFTDPVHGDLVIFLKGFFEMLCMCEPHSLDAKIINNKTKGDQAPFVAP